MRIWVVVGQLEGGASNASAFGGRLEWACTIQGRSFVSLFMLRVLLYENTGKLTACGSHLECATYEAPRRLSSNGYPGRLGTTEEPWASTKSSTPSMTRPLPPMEWVKE